MTSGESGATGSAVVNEKPGASSFVTFFAKWLRYLLCTVSGIGGVATFTHDGEGGQHNPARQLGMAVHIHAG